MEFIIQAHAKVNLGLRILKHRPDGFHEIMTIMQSITLADKLILSNTTKNLTISCNNPNLIKENLVEKAARAYFKALGKNPHVRLHLVKQIPIAAGLGGGSSDAAATLLGLNILYNLALEPQKISQLARSLGADVPFFLKGVTALATGIGDRLRPLPKFPLLQYVLINPGFTISTSWAYNQFKITWTKKQKGIKINRLFNYNQPWGNILVNDLESISIKFYPQLAKIKQTLKEMGASFTQMSGSGPTIFGVFDEKLAAIEAAKWLKKYWHNWWIRVCNGYNNIDYLAGRGLS